MAEGNSGSEAYGLGHWMRAVLDERRRVLADPTPDAVHDLRVAIRRCRSMGESAMALDAQPAWRKMRRAGKSVFEPLGLLRDTHVAMDWVRSLSEEGDPLRARLLEELDHLAGSQWDDARAALEDFNAPRWAAWSELLPQRLAVLPDPALVFGRLALERWKAGRKLHDVASKGGSAEAWHALRIGIKKFRYVLENFLPQIYTHHEKQLKKAQDLLGDVHDLDVLEHRLSESAGDVDDSVRTAWRSRIAGEREHRLTEYKRKTTGEHAWWNLWRAPLPQGGKVSRSAHATLEAWAVYRGADPSACRTTSQAAQKAYDALATSGLPLPVEPATAHGVLRSAALLCAVARQHKRGKAEKELAKAPGLDGRGASNHALVVAVARNWAGGKSELKPPANDVERQTRFLAGVLRVAEGLQAAEQQIPEDTAE